MNDITQLTRRVGFCPHCGNKAPQRLVFIQKYFGEWFDANSGEISMDGMGESTYYIAVCETCDQILVYLDLIDEYGPEDFNFSSLHWPTFGLHKSVPKIVSKCYDEAARIKNLAPNAFAVQIRRALEAVCDDRGTKPGSLQQRLKELVDRNELPVMLGEMSDALRIIGNMGAHVTDQDVKPGQVFTIDDFFKVVIEYIYVAPSKLNEYKNKLEPFPVNPSEEYTGETFNT